MNAIKHCYGNKDGSNEDLVAHNRNHSVYIFHC
jgi:hypothetical protein